VLDAAVTKSSGLPDFDTAVRFAIFKSQPFPEIPKHPGSQPTKFFIHSFPKSLSVVTPDI
jgi:outer membrane biosynthesis protein TonB